MGHHRLVVSSETLIELGEVLSRPKFDRYLPLTDRLEFFDRLRRLALHVPNVPPIVACHDPKDDKFLSLALASRAAFILSGDDHLLRMNPFREIPILSPREYLDRANEQV
jgi:putative PIN family toxin of toxin-antitoxin system